MQKPLLEVSHLRVEFPTRRGTLVALDDVTFTTASDSDGSSRLRVAIPRGPSARWPKTLTVPAPDERRKERGPPTSPPRRRGQRPEHGDERTRIAEPGVEPGARRDREPDHSERDEIAQDSRERGVARRSHHHRGIRRAPSAQLA